MTRQVKAHWKQSHERRRHRFFRDSSRVVRSILEKVGTPAPQVNPELMQSWDRMGYSPEFRFFNRALNILLSSMFILLALPLFLIVSILIRCNNDGPVFYLGRRLGRHKKPFVMYKFRSLSPGADKVIGAEVLTPAHDVMTPFGKFIRDTKIDELPQLFNVLKGDMDLVGPRPQRPEICARYGETIPDYDLRFAVKPGLIGYPQVFLPHTAPKRIQSYFDNRYIRREAKVLQDLGLILLTILLVVKKLGLKVYQKATQRATTKGLQVQGIEEKRCLKKNRVDVSDAQLEVFEAEGEKTGNLLTRGELLDIDESAFRVRLDDPIPAEGTYIFRISKKCGQRIRVKIVRVRCYGEVHAERRKVEQSETHRRFWVMNYRPLTTVDYFRIEKYLLRKSMAD